MKAADANLSSFVRQAVRSRESWQAVIVQIVAADDCPGRDALNRLVELRSDRELFLDEESCAVIRGYIFQNLATLPRTSLAQKIVFSALVAVSLSATVYGVVTSAELFLSFGLTGFAIAFAAYRSHCRELAACRQFTCEERLAIIDEIVAAGHVSAEEAISLRADVEKLARDAPELAAPWDRAAAAQEAARDAAFREQIAASRASRWSDVLARFGDYVQRPLFVLIPAAVVAVVLGGLAGFPKVATTLFLIVGAYSILCTFGVFGVRMFLQGYLLFRVRLARGEKISAWCGLALFSLFGNFIVYLAVVVLLACVEGILN